MKLQLRNLAWALIIALIAGIVLISMPVNAQMQTRVEINGVPLRTEVAPISIRGRTLVPMRDIFESLGASVVWNPNTRRVNATHGATAIELPIGANTAIVNGQPVSLDVPAMVVAGRTMVPLRFVSESLGATVVYNPNQRLVSIQTPGSEALLPSERYGAGREAAGRALEHFSVPAGTVLPVIMNDRLNSQSALPGQTFSTRLRSNYNGDQPFPQGTEVIGVVRSVQPRSGSSPGVIDVEFNSIRLPNGQTVPINGSLISLSSRDVQQQNGRLVARRSAPNRATFIGYGAGAGLVIGLITGNNVITGTLIGAAAGYIASLFSRGQARDVNIEPGTEFGVRLDNSVTYRYSRDFMSARDAYLSGSRYGTGQANPITVVVNNRNVNFGLTPPEMSDNRVFVPLAPVLNATGTTYNYDPARQIVRVYRPDGSTAEMTIGSRDVYINGTRQSISAPAYTRGSVIFVPTDFLSLATQTIATWDSRSRTVYIRS